MYVCLADFQECQYDNYTKQKNPIDGEEFGDPVDELKGGWFLINGICGEQLFF